MGKNDPKSQTGFRKSVRRLGEKLRIGGSSRSRSPAGNIAGHTRASSAPPSTDRLSHTLPHTTPQTRQAQISASPVTPFTSPLPSIQIQNVDSTPVPGSSHLPIVSGPLQTPPQNLQNKDTRANVEDVIKELQSAKADIDKRQWKYTNRHGETVVVVERIGRILKGVQKYTVLVDTAIQHSPETTALVWTGVRFILQVALNHVELMETLELAMGTIIDRMATCEFYARIYRTASFEVTLHSDLSEAFNRKLGSALDELYDAISKFTLEVQKYFGSSASWATKIGNLFVPFSTSMQPFLDEIASKEKAIQEYAEMATMKRVMESSNDLKQMEGLLNDIRGELKLLSTLDNISMNMEESLAVTRDIKDMVTTLVSNQRQTAGWETLDSDFKQLRKNYVAKHKLEFEFDLYIRAEGMIQQHDSNRFDLLDAVQEFLSDAMPQKVCLIQGAAGSGKSTFNHHLAQQLWSVFDKASNKEIAVVPVFISLSRVYTSGTHNQDLIAAFFTKQGFHKDQIDLVRHQRQFVFILDGYDEIERRDRNFYTENELDTWNAKVVITSRPEYLPPGYRSQFYPRGQPKLLQEYYLAPFSKSSIRRYISQYVKARPGHSVEEFEQYILKPDVCALVSNPFLLKMTMTVKPAHSKDKLKRGDLYHQFIDYWINQAKERLDNVQLPGAQRDAYTQLTDINFSFQARYFCQQFALTLYRCQVLEATYVPTSIFSNAIPQDQSSWKRFLANDDIKVQILRLSSPLIRQDNLYRFLHKSLRDYLVAEVILEDEAFKGCKANALINEFHLVDDPGVLDFVVEKAWQLQDYFSTFIERSKTDANFSTASANAITVLVRAGRSFAGHDLRGIRIPRADISRGFFGRAQLQNADLREIHMHQTWLEKADLSKASMNNVSFGERPFMQLPVPPNTCAFSPDGQLFASSGSDGTIRLWSVPRHETIHTFEGHGGSVWSVTFSPDGQLLASGSDDRTIRLWSVSRHETIHTFEGHSSWVWSVAFSPDGQLLASGSGDRTIRLWSVSRHEIIHIFEGHGDSVWSTTFSPDGQLLASGSDDCTIRLWSVLRHETIHTFEGHSDGVRSVTFSPDGQLLASGSGDCTIRLWSVPRHETIHTFEGHSDWIRSVAFSPDGQLLASGSDDRTIHLWSVPRHETIYAFEGHESSVRSVTFSPDGQLLASGSDDRTIRLWSVPRHETIHASEGHINRVWSVAFSPDGQLLASGSDDRTVRLWSVLHHETIHTFEGHSDGIQSVTFSPNGQLLASGSGDCTIRLWSVSRHETIHTFEGHSDGVRTVTFSPDGQLLASGSRDRTIRLWSVPRHETIHTFEGHSYGVQSVAFSPDGQLLASGSDDCTIRLWSVQRQEAIYTLNGHSNQVWSVTFSPDSQLLASGSRDHTIRLWSVPRHETIHIFEGHSHSVWSVAFSPDGQLLASGSRDCTTRLWSVPRHESIRTFESHSGPVLSVAFSPDRQLLASGSDIVHVWQVQHKASRTLDNHSWEITCLWAVPQNRLILTNVNIQDVIGLDSLNFRLLEQHGAVGEPILTE